MNDRPDDHPLSKNSRAAKRSENIYAKIDDVDELLDIVIDADEYGQKLEHAVAKRRLSAIYLLPNLFTTGALLSSFYGVLAAIDGHFERAVICIFFSMLLDGMDGRVARMTNTQSEFGEQYDSLADMVSFGVAPALIIYLWSLSSLDDISYVPSRLGWMVPFLYCACAALRLARFNIQTSVADSRYFTGLPSPSAAAVLVGLVWFGEFHTIDGRALWYLSLMITFISGILMVSPIKYYSFKHLNLNRKVSLLLMVLLISLLATITMYQPLLWFLFCLYTLSGPFFLCLKKLRSNKSAN